MSSGLKLGLVQSMEWLMAIIITLIENILIFEPLMIIMTCFVLIEFNQVIKTMNQIVIKFICLIILIETIISFLGT